MADHQAHRLTRPGEHGYKCVDGELGGLVIDDVGNTWTSHIENCRGLRLLQVVLDDPRGDFGHQLFLERAGVVDLTTRERRQPARLGRRKSKLGERIRGSHHIFIKSCVEEILNLRPKRRNAKAYQVKQVRDAIVKYRLAGGANG